MVEVEVMPDISTHASVGLAGWGYGNCFAFTTLSYHHSREPFVTSPCDKTTQKLASIPPSVKNQRGPGTKTEEWLPSIALL